MQNCRTPLLLRDRAANQTTADLDQWSDRGTWNMSQHLKGMIRVCNFQTLAYNTVDGNLTHLLHNTKTIFIKICATLRVPEFWCWVGGHKNLGVFQILFQMYFGCKFLHFCICFVNSWPRVLQVPKFIIAWGPGKS